MTLKMHLKDTASAQGDASNHFGLLAQRHIMTPKCYQKDVYTGGHKAGVQFRFGKNTHTHTRRLMEDLYPFIQRFCSFTKII